MSVLNSESKKTRDLYGIGENVMLSGISSNPHLNCAECVVIDKQQYYETSTGAKLFGYLLETDDKLRWIINEVCIMRRPPLRGFLDWPMTWQDCVWKPTAEGIRIAEEMIKSGPWRL